MGSNNPWSAARKAAARNRKNQAAAYEREFMMDEEEVEAGKETNGNYKTNKKVK